MAAMTTVVKAILTADSTRLTKELKKAKAGLKKFSESATKAGRSMTTGLTLPLAGAAAGAVKAAVGFETSMTQIQSLVGLSAETVQGFEQDVKRLSGETAQAPKDLADAMFFITSAGLRGADAVDVLEASAKAAAIGLGDTATVADLATSALNAYGAENLSAVQATDTMVAAVREGKLEASELAGSMGRVLPIASAMGVQFNEVGAAFAALSRTGTNAAEAATQIRGILASLLRPTKQSEEAMASLGLSSADLRTQIREEGLLATLKTLAERFDGQSEAAAAVFGNIRALSGVMDLMGANVETTEQIFANMADTTGMLGEAFGVVSETSGFKLQQAMADIKAALIDVGDVLIPVIVPAIQSLAGFVKDLADRFAGMSSVTQNTIVGFAGIAAVAGPLLLLVGKLAAAFAALNPWLLAVGAAVGVLAFAWADSRARAMEAEENARLFGEAMVEAGDQTQGMAERVDALVASLAHLAEPMEEGAEAVGEMTGEMAFLRSQLSKAGVLGDLEDAGVTLDTLAGAIDTNVVEWYSLMAALRLTAGGASHADDVIAELEGDTKALAETLFDAVEADEDFAEALLRIADALDTTRSAQRKWTDDMEGEAREGVQKIREEWQKYSAILGRDVLPIIDQMEAAGFSQVDILRTIEARLDAVSGAEERRATAQSLAEAAAPGWIAMLESTATETAAAAEATSDAERETADWTAALEDQLTAFDALIDGIATATDRFFTMSELEDRLAKETRDLVDALLESEAGLLGTGEAAEAARAAAKGYADAFDDLIAGMVEQGGTPDEVAQRFLNLRDDIEATAAALGLLPEEIALLSEALGAIPSTLPVEVQVAVAMQDVEFAGQLVSDFLDVTPFADGGLVTRPTLALIGEAGPEAVVPISGNSGSGLPPGLTGGDTFVTVNVTGVSGEEVVEAINREIRNNGAAPVSVTGDRRR